MIRLFFITILRLAAFFKRKFQISIHKTPASRHTRPAAVLRVTGSWSTAAETAEIAERTASIADEDNISKMQRLIDMLEENDDIQAVWHNWENVPE